LNAHSASTAQGNNFCYVREEFTTHINTLFGQNEEIFNVTTGGIYTNHQALKGNRNSKEVTDE
jgi:hypothetical protein